METKVEVSADLNMAIDQITKRLGVASNKILPLYAEQIYVNALSWMVGGALMILGSLLLFLIPLDAPKPVVNEWDASDLYAFGRVLRVIVFFCVSWAGIHTIIEQIEDAVSPMATAIRRLLGQLKWGP